ncbi:MAG: hypothetical protein BGO10_08660 [Chlamydia sp. 32-24]|nr:MAG: hypothetical protein BGO10_08660 [Chlamydia sp. 32-24]
MDPFDAIQNYVKCCTDTFNQEQFSKLLADDVKLNHCTLDNYECVENTHEIGKEKVTQLFEQFIFSNTKDVSVSETETEKKGSAYVLKLKLSETKVVNGQSIRYYFKEKTQFTFQPNTNMFASISSVVKRRELTKFKAC